MQIHASCAARHGHGVLLIGPSGSGKSDLLLRLLDCGFTLVADDRVDIAQGAASPPAALAGLLEIGGVGIIRLPYSAPVALALVVELGQAVRLPAPSRHPTLGLPLVRLDPFHASAPAKVGAALACATGRVAQLAGAFA